ncbi:MAG: OmpA family protein, partial [Hyphomicrobiales bacterium]|nr:OmpA family protein [Hyphomicrobiales bacterium]
PRPPEKPADIGALIERLDPAPETRHLQSTAPTRLKVLVGNESRDILVDYGHAVDLTVYFANASAALTDENRAALDRLGQALASDALNEFRYLIAGHTDAVGAEHYNAKLSRQRAAAVRDYLVMNWQIAPERLVVHGWGETRPKDPAHPDAEINRRVEIAPLVEDVAPVAIYRPPVAVGHDDFAPGPIAAERFDYLPAAPPAYAVQQTAPTVRWSGEPAAVLIAPAPVACAATHDPYRSARWLDLDDFGGAVSPLDCRAALRAGSGSVLITVRR